MSYDYFKQFFLLGLMLLGSSGCGYTLQGTRNPLYEKEGIRKIYITPVSNNSYKAGVENLVYSSLIRNLESHRRVIIVQDPKDADAILSGSVGNATYYGSAGTGVVSLNPAGVGANIPTAPFVVSTEYTAVLSCYFTLSARNPRPGKKGVIWSSSFNRAKPFPGANQLDVPGTTSALINDSEFDRALTDLARSMMDDVHESMLAMF